MLGLLGGDQGKPVVLIGEEADAATPRGDPESDERQRRMEVI